MEAYTLLNLVENMQGKLDKITSETTCKVHNGLTELGG